MTNPRPSLIHTVLDKLGIRLLREKHFNRLRLQHDAYEALLKLPPLPSGDADSETVEAIVFSRDRAMQLHALLTSYYDQINPAAPLHILYKATSRRHQQAYQQLQTMDFPGEITWHEESGFYTDFMAILNTIKARRLFFLVDDIVFIRPVNLTGLLQFDNRHYIPSLRLGKNISQNYTCQLPMPQPSLTDSTDGEYCFWTWSDGTLDWGYPLSVDGHLFATDEIRVLCNKSRFSAPNSLEKALQLFRPVYLARTGVCYPQSCIVNLPINRVQNENDNISGDIEPAILLDKWESGLRIDTHALYGTLTRSVHEELPVAFIQE